MNTYQSYKPSGIDWIGEIPKEWSTKRLTYSFKIQKGKIPSELLDEPIVNGLPYLSMDVLRGNEPTEFSIDKNIVEVKDGDIGILWDGSNSGEIIKIKRNGILSSTVSLLTIFDKGLNKEFGYYLLKLFENDFKSNTTGMGIPHVNGNYVRETKLIIPPLKEQLQIVQFLDDKTDLIDKLISTKERKITLLKEQRTSLINEVVTKGLNPNVKMKDSGVEWIGEIPENWKVGKLKHHSELNISSVDKHIFDEEISVRVCNYTDVYYNEFISNSLELRIGSCTTIEFNKFLLKKGDVIITKDSESPSDIGVPSLVIDELENVVCGYHLSIIKSNLDSLIGEYLFRQLQTTRVRRYFEVNSNGITRFGLGKSSVLELPLILPPVKEQIEIIKHLDSKTKEIDDLVQLEKKKIDLLKEYRQSLISEVVTGKIKVTQ
jgi:type I restriction enzyme S subunit